MEYKRESFLMEKVKYFNVSMFFLRLVVGIVFVVHGSQKLFGMFDGIGLDGTAKLIEGSDLAQPYMIAVIWGTIEFIGGILLVLGVLARWAAVMIVLTIFIYLFKMDLAYS
ncbi:MAG: DoxX family protein, partial [Candidatus Omnitrophota bacterium]